MSMFMDDPCGEDCASTGAASANDAAVAMASRVSFMVISCGSDANGAALRPLIDPPRGRRFHTRSREAWNGTGVARPASCNGR
jgi:hypothetical protein